MNGSSNSSFQVPLCDRNYREISGSQFHPLIQVSAMQHGELTASIPLTQISAMQHGELTASI
ncbi:MAG: hypothetical protein HC866_21260 [Leptolyngbyaceae cyanobacterium RU_5_1]|nr:hypothetical protein [Leptolyngbyaceae cyanobacterium RU_5_1]